MRRSPGPGRGAAWVRSLYSGNDTYRGEGRSLGLARGLLVYVDRRNITREGMGIGSPAARIGRCTVFSRHCETGVTWHGALRADPPPC